MCYAFFHIYRVCHEKVFSDTYVINDGLERWDDGPFVVFFNEFLNFWRL